MSNSGVIILFDTSKLCDIVEHNLTICPILCNETFWTKLNLNFIDVPIKYDGWVNRWSIINAYMIILEYKKVICFAYVLFSITKF